MGNLYPIKVKERRDMKNLIEYLHKDFEDMKASDFESFICLVLEKSGRVFRQIMVPNRGDGRKGRVDVLFIENGQKIGIEIDRKNPRAKSIFKLKQMDVDRRFVFLRTPFRIIEIHD